MANKGNPMSENPDQISADIDKIPAYTVPEFMAESTQTAGNTQMTEAEANRLWDDLKDEEDKTQIELDASVKKSRGHVDKRLALTKQLTETGFTRYTSHGKKDRWLKD